MEAIPGLIVAALWIYFSFRSAHMSVNEPSSWRNCTYCEACQSHIHYSHDWYTKAYHPVLTCGCGSTILLERCSFKYEDHKVVVKNEYGTIVKDDR